MNGDASLGFKNVCVYFFNSMYLPIDNFLKSDLVKLFSSFVTKLELLVEMHRMSIIEVCKV